MYNVESVLENEMLKIICQKKKVKESAELWILLFHLITG